MGPNTKISYPDLYISYAEPSHESMVTITTINSMEPLIKLNDEPSKILANTQNDILERELEYLKRKISKLCKTIEYLEEENKKLEEKLKLKRLNLLNI